MSNISTRQQEIANYAYNECIKEILKKENIRDKYLSLARKLPSLVMVNGLGQTLAFLKAKAGPKEPGKDKEHAYIYAHISGWILRQVPSKNKSQNETLLEVIIKENSAYYRQATAEAMAFLPWLKRFAEAESKE